MINEAKKYGDNLNLGGYVLGGYVRAHACEHICVYIYTMYVSTNTSDKSLRIRTQPHV